MSQRNLPDCFEQKVMNHFLKLPVLQMNVRRVTGVESRINMLLC